MIQRPTDKEIKEFLEFAVKWDLKLPDPINYPRSFMHYWRVWKYVTRPVPEEKVQNLTQTKKFDKNKRVKAGKNLKNTKSKKRRRK